MYKVFIFYILIATRMSIVKSDITKAEPLKRWGDDDHTHQNSPKMMKSKGETCCRINCQV